MNLALVEGDQINVAVVGDASTDEIHVAERGRGAWASRHGDRRQLATTELSQTIVIESGRSIGARREHAARFARDAIRADRWDVRNLGSTLSLPYVAAGRPRRSMLAQGLSSLPKQVGPSLTLKAYLGPSAPTRSLPAPIPVFIKS